MAAAVEISLSRELRNLTRDKTMPYKVRKTKAGKYRVTSPNGVKARGTSKRKALSQVRLLNMIKHGKRVRKRRRK